MINFFEEHILVLACFVIVVMVLLYIWLIRVHSKVKKSTIDKTLLTNIPWVVSLDKIKRLEERSWLWYILTIPYRFIASIDPWGMRRAGFPVAIIALVIIYILSLFR